ncbi:uncharacterized protein LOC100197183 isoform X2 [Hydra vulgaris]|uniref:uncharacterized protein LOC100197183 isoform X2 n=1 Tax=Hydra vulgaris TaxID=6087 RepID=UPI001F5FF0AC|nr:uncharacterized protein LOC100197183 isoform X2 [Hydra vulgaris]
MAQMTDVLIAKIVLGYLTSQKLSKTIDSFLGESEFLNTTNIDNNKERILNQLEDLNLLPSLEDILNDYFAYNQTSDVKSEKVFQLWRQLDIVLGQIRSLTLGKKKNSLFLDRKRKVVNGYNNHIPRRNITNVTSRAANVPDCSTNVSSCATNVSDCSTNVLHCNTNVLDCVTTISDHVSNASDCVTNATDYVSNVSHCATNDSHCVTNVLECITNVSDCAPLNQDASDVPQSHCEQSAIASKEIIKLCKTKKSPKRKSTCPKKRVQVDSICSSHISNNLEAEFVDAEELPSKEVLQKRLSNDVWQTAGKLAQNINMIVGGDLNTLHLNSSRKDQLDFNEFINHITVEHDFSSLFAMIKDVPYPLLDIDDQSEAQNLNILQDYKYLEGFTSIQNESSIPKDSESSIAKDFENINCTNILETKSRHNNETLQSELDNLIGESEEHPIVAKIPKDVKSLVANASEEKKISVINNRDNEFENCLKPPIDFVNDNSLRNSSDLYKMDSNLEKKDLALKANNSTQSPFGISNDHSIQSSSFEISNDHSIQSSSFGITNEQIRDRDKKFVNSSYFLNGDSFMHFLTDVNCVDPAIDGSSEFHVNSFLNKPNDPIPENLESSQLHVRNLNNELNSILESHIQVSEGVPRIQSNMQLAEPLLLSASALPTISFQNMYQPQETYLNLPELKSSSGHSPPPFSEYHSSMNFRKQCLKDSLTIPKISSNNSVDESVSIASDALLLLATSPVKQAPSLITSKIPGFLHPPNEISALLKSFISNDSLIYSEFKNTQDIQTVVNDNKIEHTSQLPSFSPIKVSNNTSYSTMQVGKSVSTNNKKKKSKNEHNGCGTISKNARNNQDFVPRIFNFVRSPKKAPFVSQNKSRLKFKGKKLNSETIIKTKGVGIVYKNKKNVNASNNSLSSESGVSSCSNCSNDSLKVITAAPFVKIRNSKFLNNPVSSSNNYSETTNKIKSSDSFCIKKNPMVNLTKIIGINQEIPILTLNKVNDNKDNEIFETPEKVENFEKKSNLYNSPKGLSSSKDSFAERFKKLQAKESLKKQNITPNALNDQNLDINSTVKANSFLKSPSQSNVNKKSPSPVFDSKFLSSPRQGCTYRIQGNTISPLHAINNETSYFPESNVCGSESFVSISPVIPYKQPSKNIKSITKIESNKENSKCGSLLAQENSTESSIKIDTTPTKNVSLQNLRPKQLTKKEIKVRFNFKSPKKTKTKVVNKTLHQTPKAKSSKTVDTAASDLTNELFLRKQKTLFNQAAKTNIKLYSPVKDLFNCSKINTNLLLIPYAVQIKSQDLLYVVDTSFQDLIASSNYELEIILEPPDTLNSFPLPANVSAYTVQSMGLANESACKLSVNTEKQSSNSGSSNQSSKAENNVYNSNISLSFTDTNKVSTVQPSNVLNSSEILSTQSNCGTMLVPNKKCLNVQSHTLNTQSHTLNGAIISLSGKSDFLNKDIVKDLTEKSSLVNSFKSKEVIVLNDNNQPIATLENKVEKNTITNNELLTAKSELIIKIPDLHKKIVTKRSFLCDEDDKSNPKKRKEDNGSSLVL